MSWVLVVNSCGARARREGRIQFYDTGQRDGRCEFSVNFRYKQVGLGLA